MAMLVAAYYCTFVGYATYIIYKRTRSTSTVLTSIIMEIPIMGRVFGIW